MRTLLLVLGLVAVLFCGSLCLGSDAVVFTRPAPANASASDVIASEAATKTTTTTVTEQAVQPQVIQSLAVPTVQTLSVPVTTFQVPVTTFAVAPAVTTFAVTPVVEVRRPGLLGRLRAFLNPPDVLVVQPAVVQQQQQVLVRPRRVRVRSSCASGCSF